MSGESFTKMGPQHVKKSWAPDFGALLQVFRAKARHTEQRQQIQQRNHGKAVKKGLSKLKKRRRQMAKASRRRNRAA